MNFDWLTIQNLEHLIVLLTFASPFIPPQYMAYLGVINKGVKYLSGNFGHAKNASDAK